MLLQLMETYSGGYSEQRFTTVEARIFQITMCNICSRMEG